LPPRAVDGDHAYVVEAWDRTKELARANRAFYRAFEALDIESMLAIWDDDESIRCVHPGAQMLVGREQVFGSWRAIFAGQPQLSFDLTDVDLRVMGDLGWVSCEEHLRMHDAQKDPEFKAVCTNLYLLREGQWRLVLHHASPLARRLGP
jgi:ketosteroid isomerase-like protein